MVDKTLPSTPNPDVERFERWAGTYDRSFLQWFFFGPVHAKLLNLLLRAGPKSPSRILDVGCGTGRLLRRASRRWPQAQLLGVDPAAHMLAEAARLNAGAAFKQAPAESLPFPDQSFDIVMSSISFHHWTDQAKGVREIARVLRPGGCFCLADHSVLLTRLLGEKVRSRAEIRALMKAAGLTVRQHEGVGLLFVLITLAQK